MLAADAEPGGCKRGVDHGRDDCGDRRNDRGDLREDVSHTEAGTQQTGTHSGGRGGLCADEAGGMYLREQSKPEERSRP